MTDTKIVSVFGLGLIGGSLAASLKSRPKAWLVRAVDRRRSTLEYALRRGFIDEIADTPREGVEGADLLVLATPVRSIRQLLASLSNLVQPGQVVTDVGSTKVSIVNTARTHLPDEAGFVGGHPVAGSERAGVESAEAGLFEGRPCVLTPTRETPREALEIVVEMWRELGAEVVLLDPETHDRLFALVSHLPHMVAYSLVNTVTAETMPRETALGGGALEDFTRVAQSPASMWRDICLENGAAIVDAIDRFSTRLSELRTALAEGDEAVLGEFFQRAAESRGKPWML